MTLSLQISALDQDDFFQAMRGEDPLGLVIKAAIFIENQLIGLIEENVANIDHLNKVQLDYSGRVHLAAAFGLRSSLVAPLQSLGTIRNRFAHRLDAQLTENEVNNFHQAFHGIDRSMIEKIYQRTRKVTPPRQPSKFSSLPALERFTFCATALRAALVVARAQAAGQAGPVDDEHK